MFSIKESIKYGWEKLKLHMNLGILTTLLILAVSALSGEEFILTLAIFVFLIILKIGYTKIFLRIDNGETPKFAEIFDEYKTFWRYLGTTILSCLTTIGGLILLIIPGIFWAIRFSFSVLIVVDTKMGPVASMKESYAITKGSFWKLLGFWVIIGLINIAGAMLFLVGLLVTVPVSALASIHIYRKLSSQKAGLTTTSPQVS